MEWRRSPRNQQAAIHQNWKRQFRYWFVFELPYLLDFSDSARAIGGGHHLASLTPRPSWQLLGAARKPVELARRIEQWRVERVGTASLLAMVCGAQNRRSRQSLRDCYCFLVQNSRVWFLPFQYWAVVFPRTARTSGRSFFYPCPFSR